MRIRKSVVISLILIGSFFLMSCSKKGEEPGTDSGTNKPIENAESFKYYYTSEDYEEISTKTQVLGKNHITRTGYIFEGVFSGEYGNGIQYFDSQGQRIQGIEIQNHSNLYAKWTIKNYSLKLMVDGAEFKNSQIQYGTVLTVLDVPVETGLTFTGWTNKAGTLFSDSMGYVVQDKKGFTEESGYPFDEEKNVVELYANFKIAEYTITYDYLDRGENKTIQVKHGEVLTLPKVEDYENYECLGWSYQSPTGEKYYENEPITSDMTLYANWLRYKDIRICDEHGKNLGSKRVYQDGKSIKVEDIEVPVSQGYVVEGWYKNQSCSGIPITSLSYGNEDTVYIRLDPIQYEVYLSLKEDEALENGTTSYTYTCENELELPMVIKENYDFVGWCTDSKLTSDPITEISRGQTGNMILYPKFKGKDKKAILDSRNGSAVQTVIVEYGKEYTLVIPTLDGFAFVGWFNEMEEQMTDKEGHSLGVWKNSEVTNLHAGYKTISFSSGLGTVENPYLIATSQHLQNIKKFPSACFKVIADITIDKGFETISEFSGALDGDNHKLNFANRPYLFEFNRVGNAQFAGLIKNNKGSISNFKIDGLSVKSNGNCHSGTYLIEMGGVIAINQSTGSIKNIVVTTGDFKCDRNNSVFGVVCGVNYGVIEGCSVVKANIYATGDCGGIVGRLVGGKVSGCTFSGTIGLYIADDNGGENLRSWGGIVGWAFDLSGNGIIISNCIVSACTFNYYGEAQVYHKPGFLGMGHSYCNLQVRVGVICGSLTNKNNSVFENCSFEDASSTTLNLMGGDFHNGSHERKFLFAYFNGMIGLLE